MASKTDLDSRTSESYVDTGSEKSLTITLSGTPGTVTTVRVPDESKGFRVFSSTDNLRFGVNKTVAATATCSSVAIASTAFKSGGIIIAGQWETRLLPSVIKQKATDLERYITFSSLVASSSLQLEVF